jgi:hypothetical protein
MAGSSATTPPKSTAKRSREMAPNSTGWRRMKRSPCTAWSQLGRSRGATSRGCTWTKAMVTPATTISAAMPRYGSTGSAA